MIRLKKCDGVVRCSGLIGTFYEVKNLICLEKPGTERHVAKR